MSDYPPEFLDMIAPGCVVRQEYDPDNINNQVRHIRAIVDDDQVVYRVWNTRTQRWLYRIESCYGLWYEWQQGVLKRK